MPLCPKWHSGKESPCQAVDMGSIPALWRSPGEENGNSLQYSRLGNLMDRGALGTIVHGVMSDTTEWLNNNNNASCSNMDVPREYHSKWNKSDRERQISNDIT